MPTSPSGPIASTEENKAKEGKPLSSFELPSFKKINFKQRP
jgi:hypothetical protein